MFRKIVSLLSYTDKFREYTQNHIVSEGVNIFSGNDIKHLEMLVGKLQPEIKTESVPSINMIDKDISICMIEIDNHNESKATEYEMKISTKIPENYEIDMINILPYVLTDTKVKNILGNFPPEHVFAQIKDRRSYDPAYNYLLDDVMITIFFPKNFVPKILPDRDQRSKPLLLLDVDGVINVLIDRNITHKFFPDIETKIIMSEGQLYRINYSPSIIERINSLAEKCEIRWLTSWKKSARYFLAPSLGLYDFEVQPGYKTCIGDTLSESDKKRTIIWIDDELSFEGELDIATSAFCLTHHVSKLILVNTTRRCTEYFRGLTHADCDELDKILENEKS